VFTVTDVTVQPLYLNSDKQNTEK